MLKVIDVFFVLMHCSTKIQQKEDSLSSNKFEVKVINFAQAKKRQQERKVSSLVLFFIHIASINEPLNTKNYFLFRHQAK